MAGFFSKKQYAAIVPKAFAMKLLKREFDIELTLKYVYLKINSMLKSKIPNCILFFFFILS